MAKDAKGHGSEARGSASVPDQHRAKIARQDANMPEALRGVMSPSHQGGVDQVGRMPPVGATNEAGHYVVPGGQGNDPSHAQGQFHQAAVANGYTYSHSTPIGDQVHHTYEQAGHKIGVMGNKWETSVSSASGHRTTGTGVDSLRIHLAGKASRYPALRNY